MYIDQIKYYLSLLDTLKVSIDREEDEDTRTAMETMYNHIYKKVYGNKPKIIKIKPFNHVAQSGRAIEYDPKGNK